MTLTDALNRQVPGVQPDSRQNQELSEQLQQSVQKSIYQNSLKLNSRVLFALAGQGNQKSLILVSGGEFVPEIANSFEGETRIVEIDRQSMTIKTCPLTPLNARALRVCFPFAAPVLTGIRRSIGCGDRIGLATPGHIRAVRATGVMPILAQQSIREMTRTQRTAQQVMDDATWGVFQEGFQQGFGSDADHLKSKADIDATLEAGFTMFTIDPGDYVDDQSDFDNSHSLLNKFQALDWKALEYSADDCKRLYADKSFRISDDYQLKISKDELVKAAVKYGRAVIHTTTLFRYLQQRSGGKAFELEVSVDETATPTTPAEHFYVASELKRLGVQWISLAPRFIGEFEKGIDYKGDLKTFERAFISHVRIAQYVGPYKISLHSGSDKFSIYPIAAKHAGELIHVKTAGTSYLEALHALGKIDPDFFEEIYTYSYARFETDKASYHISTSLPQITHPSDISGKNTTDILNDIHCRQMLHVTFGSVLTEKKDDCTYRFRERLMRLLGENEEIHYELLAKHLGRHAAPFSA
ncbi:hypothetical protein JXJ21_11380 [candidate division KSB1 bacterium]|nr:hypothetical protein [candidate division KSB1 bacterium]